MPRLMEKKDWMQTLAGKHQRGRTIDSYKKVSKAK